MSNLQELNKELTALGLETITDFDPCPERTKYVVHLSEADYDDKDWLKELKGLEAGYLSAFYKYFAHKHPHLLYEFGDDKTYWNYNEETGVYDELTLSSVLSLVINLLITEGLELKATEPNAKTIVAKYRARYVSHSINYTDFDVNTDWFHAKNGWVNLKTKEFKPHSPDIKSRRVSDVVYDSEATCPLYDNYLDIQTGFKKDVVRVIDQFSGYLLCPDTRQQKTLIFAGKSGSGKSTLVEMWAYLLGDMFIRKSLAKFEGDAARFGATDFSGKHLIWFNEANIKRSHMGDDLINLIDGMPMPLERKGIQSTGQHIKITAKCVLTINRLPQSAEDGIYRRMLLVPFEKSFEERGIKMDVLFPEKLRAEASGVLNRMLNGYADLQKMGQFTMIEGHAEMIEEYKTISDPLSGFLDDYFEPVVGDDINNTDPVPAKELFEAYRLSRGMRDSFVNSLTSQKFGLSLKSQTLEKFSHIYAKRQKTGKVWVGLKLKKEYKFSDSGMIVESFVSDVF